MAGREHTVKGMDSRNEIRDFLTSRRARITPEQAGLPAYGGNRRVAGLRREEVALLAGVSIDYYTRLERGKATGVSESVLEGLARALQLDEAERAHLFDLVRAASTATRPRRRSASSARQRVRPSVRRILDSMTTTPAYVRNDRLDILAANRLGRALYSPLFGNPAQPANPARFIFLDPAAERFYLDWERQAQDVVAALRSAAGRDPYDRALSNLIGELSTRSETFRTWWAAHNVRLHRTGVKRLHHPVVGDLTLTYEALELSADPGLRINAYTAEPGTPSDDALNLLASWAVTLDQAETETADAADGA
jgi:transcriptional regulator with XRE-family HTH domain